MNKEESEDETICGQNESEDEETFTKEEIKETIIEDMKEMANDLLNQMGNALCFLSFSYTVAVITLLTVTKKSYNKWR